MANGKFSGEKQLKRKTEMCGNYQQDCCNWGDECNYAHSKEELEAAQKRLLEGSVNGTADTQDQVGGVGCLSAP